MCVCLYVEMSGGRVCITGLPQLGFVISGISLHFLCERLLLFLFYFVYAHFLYVHSVDYSRPAKTLSFVSPFMSVYRGDLSHLRLSFPLYLSLYISFSLSRSLSPHQTIRARDTGEVLFSIACSFDVAQPGEPSAHHVYKLMHPSEESLYRRYTA